MPELTLKLEREPEEEIEGWHVADGHWDAANGIGILLVVAPATREQIRRGMTSVELGRSVSVTAHCADVVVQRQRDAVLRKARSS